MQRIPSILLPLLLTLSGCTLLDGGTPIPGPGETADDPVVLLRLGPRPDDPAHLLAIDSVSVQSDTLSLRVSFGGCDTADFELVAWNYFLESYPVQTHLTLQYEETDCDAVIIQDLRFDLTPLRDTYREAYQTTVGVIDLSVLGAGDVRASVRYTF